MVVFEDEIKEEMDFWAGYTKQGFARSATIFSSIKLLLFCLFKFSYLFLTRKKNWKFDKQNRIDLLVIYLTENQKKAVNEWLVYEERYKSISNSPGADYQIPWGKFSWYCIKKLFKIYIYIARSGNFRLYMPWLEEFVRYVAGKEIAVEIFERINPSFILFSNDHSGISRAINRVAKEKNIKLIYTQHACVGKGFPHLNFDLSMLDGLQALEQYIESGQVSGSVILTGRQKKSFNRNNNLNKNRVGLATNSLDDLNVWDKIINELHRNKYTILLRCHPAEKRIAKWKTIADKYRIKMHIGNYAEFIENIDVLVAGLTGATLDAYIMGVPTVSFVGRSKQLNNDIDYYDFAKNGICVCCDQINKLPNAINKALDKGVNFKSALLYDVGVILDPAIIKNELIRDYMKLEKGFCEDINNRGYVEVVHNGVVKCYMPYKYALEIYS